ncbi:response regulator transcription factor [Leucobacter sp. M11]|uniref:response regulator transcription factor n=1 Tax=Leucobacter sp. M11 TaxID=2993565 RepID=UPI002D8084CB|nr:response regulator transcription factor [Leucobacter sp. M11]MEB4615162.1 response regulator transcription factor [Leucobacter sp. M11]
MSADAANPAPAPIRVLLVDDQPLARLGISLSLGSDPGISVIAEAGTGEEGIALAERMRPDVIVMDVRMPGIGGIEATRRLTSQTPGAPVLVLTSFDLDRFAFGALRAGASAFLLKSAAPEELVAAVRTVHAGDAVVAPRITRRLIEHFTERPAGAADPIGSAAPADSVRPPVSPAPEPAAGRAPDALEAPDSLEDQLAALSPRELDVFLAVATGLTNGEIADRLFLSTATVKSHINRIFAKLHLRDRVHAVLLAHRLGITARE